MNAKAGVVTAQVAWLAALPVAVSDWKEAVAGAGVAMVFSYLPDLDHDRSTAGQAAGAGASGIRWLFGGHRMGTHSIVMAALAWLFVWVLNHDVPPIHTASDVYGWPVEMFKQITGWYGHPVPMDIALANAGAVGILSHIWCDLWTKMGVGLFWPLSRIRVRLGNLVTGTHDRAYIILVRCVGVMVALIYLNQFYLSGGTA